MLSTGILSLSYKPGGSLQILRNPRYITADWLKVRTITISAAMLLSLLFAGSMNLTATGPAFWYITEPQQRCFSARCWPLARV